MHQYSFKKVPKCSLNQLWQRLWIHVWSSTIFQRFYISKYIINQRNFIEQHGLFILLANQPLSEHEGGFGFSLIIGGRRAADDNGGSTVTTQRVLQDTGHLAVSVGDVGLVYTTIYAGKFKRQNTNQLSVVDSEKMYHQFSLFVSQKVLSQLFC